MKLLIATQALVSLAGAPLHTVDLCRGFRRAGHDVSVFTLQPGALSDALKEEGYPIFLLSDYDSLSKEPFDLVYLHPVTCEVLLGLMFGGKIPLVRCYLGKIAKIMYPTNGNFLSAALYLSEEVREAMTGMSGYKSNIPSMIARGVYDETQFPLREALREPPSDKPNYAVVTNHFDSDLTKILEAAARERHCSFTHFGYPHNSVPITAELLGSFDAVITIGRTVLSAAALGIPVYVCDIHGADGWMKRENFVDLQHRNFSGRWLATRDWDLVQQQLLDTNQWPTTDDLSWLSGRIELDHALYRRVEQLEGFFADVIEKAPPPVEPPEGYSAVFRYIDSKGEQTPQSVPGDAHRISELVQNLKESRERGRAQTQDLKDSRERISELVRNLKESRERGRAQAQRIRKLQRKLRKRGKGNQEQGSTPFD